MINVINMDECLDIKKMLRMRIIDINCPQYPFINHIDFIVIANSNNNNVQQ